MIEWLIVLFIYTFFMALAAWWGRQKGYKDGFDNGKYVQRAEDEIQFAVMRDKLVKLEKTCMRQRRIIYSITEKYPEVNDILNAARSDSE